MKKVCFLLLLCFLVNKSFAQQAIGDCAKNIFINADSVIKAGKNPFEEWKTCVVGKPFPDFTAKAINGDVLEFDKLKGKIIVINFWFIGCHPCIAELPALNKLVKEYQGKEVVFLAFTWETIASIRKDFLSKYKLDFTILPEANDLISKVSGSGYPTTYILDRKGIIKEAWNGGSIDEKAKTEAYIKIKPIIDELLKAQ